VIRAVGPDAAAAPVRRERVEARRLLLDALLALEPIRGAFVLGGGQAIDVRFGAPPFPLAPSRWWDGDLTMDAPAFDGSASPAERLRSAGLRLRGGPGHWARAEGRLAAFFGHRARVRLDVVLPDEPWPARLAASDPRRDGSASIMRPMVVTLLDAEDRLVGSLDPADDRAVRSRVAGPASLLLTKVHKLETRRKRAIARRRALASIPAKDVLDVVRLLTAADDDLERDVERIRRDPRGRVVARESLSFLRDGFVPRDGVFRRLATDALAAFGALDLVECAARRSARLVAAPA
jgi:hypothetical protein